MPAINITGSYKYVDITAGHALINGQVLYINSTFRINDTDLTGAPSTDFGDYYIHLRPNRRVMESYYSKNWEYVIYSTTAGGAAPTVNPDELAIGMIQKRQVSGNTILTAVKLNRGKRLIDTKDISDGAIRPAQISTISTDVFNFPNTVIANLGLANQTQLGYAGNGNAGLMFGTAGDTNLYRGGAGSLTTGGIFNATNVYASSTNAAALRAAGDSGATGVWNRAAIAFQDTNATGGRTWQTGARSDSGSGQWYVSDETAGSVRLAINSTGTVTTVLDHSVGQNFTVAGSINHNGTFQNLVSGVVIQWNAGDTKLYRASAGKLQTDTNFSAQGFVGGAGVGSGKAFQIGDDAEIWDVNTADTINIRGLSGSAANGKITFGSAGDTNLYRGGVDTLVSDDAIRSLAALQYGQAADTIMRISAGQLTNGPGIEFGPGGSTARDTNLYRINAGVLKTDNSVQVAQSAELTTAVSGNVSAPVTRPGTLDTSRNRIIRYSTVDVNNYTMSLFRFSTDTANWMPSEGYEIITRTGYHNGGSWTRAIVTGAYTTPARIRVIETHGPEPVIPVLSPVTIISGTIGWFEVTVPIPAYNRVACEIKYGSVPETGSTPTSYPQVQFTGTVVNNGATANNNYAGFNEVQTGFNFYAPGLTAGAADTNLYRSAAGIVKTDGVVEAIGGFTQGGNVVGFSPGDLKESAAYSIQGGWLLTDGTNTYSRTTYANLFNAITFTASVTTNATTTVTTATTANLFTGVAVEGTGIPAGATVASVTNTTTFVLSAAATASATITARFSPHGLGNNSTTFAVPDYRDRSLMMLGAGPGLTAKIMGQKVGVEPSNMPSHNHGGATGTGNTGTVSANHNHNSHSHNGAATIDGGTFYNVAGQDVGNVTGTENQNHTHSVPALSISSAGSGGTQDNIHPVAVVNIFIKT